VSCHGSSASAASLRDRMILAENVSARPIESTKLPPSLSLSLSLFLSLSLSLSLSRIARDPEGRHKRRSDVDEISLARGESSPPGAHCPGNQSFLHFHDNDRRTRAEPPSPIRKETPVSDTPGAPLEKALSSWTEFKIRDSELGAIHGRVGEKLAALGSLPPFLRGTFDVIRF